MNYYLGIDIGTSSSKAVAFDQNGEVLANISIAYKMYHPHAGWSEQEPEEIFDAVVTCINRVIQHLTPAKPILISFSAAMHSLITVGENGKLLTRCIIWADNRSDSIAQNLKNSPEGEIFYRLSGVPIHSMSPLSKLLWLQATKPSIFSKAHKFIGIKEYVFYKLFSQYVVDTSIASATGLLNINTLKWDEEILKFAAITPASLSTVVSTKATFYYKNAFPGLSINSDVPFVIGASDGALSNLGTGATNSNAMAVTIGTSGAARMLVPAPVTDKKMRTFCYHVKDNFYVAGGANNNGAVVMQWLKDKLLQTNEAYDELLEQANSISEGSNGLLFLPYVLGERAPIWNANAKGVFFGLSIQHTKAHLVRATLEGVIYSMYSIIKILAEQFEVTGLHASGGFAKSPLWLQILADVSNTTVLVSDTIESSALGAVMLGAESLGITTDFKKTISAAYEPNSFNNNIYQKHFNKFERLYELLKAEMITNSTDSVESGA